MTFADFAALHRRQHVLFAVEHFGRALEVVAFFAGDLCNRSFGREAAPKNRQVPRLLNRCVPRMDDVLSFGEIGQACQILRERLSGDGEAVAMKCSASQ